MTMTQLGRQDFEKLLEFRVTLRRFQRWSEDQPPTVGDLAGYLLLRPHSAVELVNRAEAAGLVNRIPDGGDGRVIRVRLTAEGDRVMQELTQAHLERLNELAAVLDELVNHPGDSDGGC